MSCCPPNAEKYLAATYATKGSTHSLPNGHEFYASGPTDSKRAVIVIPDVYGWNGGRTRNIADWLADAGYYAVVPKLLVPPLEGGTDGDGLPPTFDFAVPEDLAKFGPYMHLISWDDIIKPRIISVTDHIKSLDISKIHMSGFCWGGWVGSLALSCELADNYVSLAIPHPSLHLEALVFGRQTVDLVNSIKKPVYFMPAKGDPDDYRTTWFEIVKKKFPTSRLLDFPDENHGFVPRADISNEATHAAVLKAMEEMHSFFKENEAVSA